MAEPALEYVAARRVLLDAFGALRSHLDNLILVGAQAVYLHTGDADLNVPLMTTDADLAINTTDLADVPEIGAAMRKAGFTPGANPGHWIAVSEIAIDLMVVPHQANTTKTNARAARLAPHETATARVTHGLEPVLIDNEHVTIGSLETADSRSFSVRAAGPAALLVAKTIKIAERFNQAESRPDRLKQKDALDAFRLLQAIDTPVLVRGFTAHLFDEHASDVTRTAIELLRAHGTDSAARFPMLAAEGAVGDPAIAAAFAALVKALLAALPH